MLLSAMLTCAGAQSAEIVLDPDNMPRLGTIDERFQSYNIEMVEVTGGPFWKPYDAQAGAQPDLTSNRTPKDLANPRLRMLAAALSPAYLRISGTSANITYFAGSGAAPSTPRRQRARSAPATPTRR